MSLLSAEGLNALAVAGNPSTKLKRYQATTEYEKGVRTPTNVMLSGIMTLDGSNQWANVELARDCSAYQQFFMQQLSQKGFDPGRDKVTINGKSIADPRFKSERYAACGDVAYLSLRSPGYPLYPASTAAVEVISKRRNAELAVSADTPGWTRRADGQGYAYKNDPAPNARDTKKLTIVDRTTGERGDAFVTLEPKLTSRSGELEVNVGSMPTELDLNNDVDTDIRWRIAASDKRNYGAMGNPARIKALESSIAALKRSPTGVAMDVLRGQIVIGAGAGDVVSGLKASLLRERATFYPPKSITPSAAEKKTGRVPVRVVAEDFGPMDGAKPPGGPVFRKLEVTLQLSVNASGGTVTAPTATTASSSSSTSGVITAADGSAVSVHPNQAKLVKIAEGDWKTQYTYTRNSVYVFPWAPGQKLPWVCTHFVWSVYVQAGMPYQPGEVSNIWESKQFQRVTVPIPGDLVAWHNKLGSTSIGGGNNVSHVGLVQTVENGKPITFCHVATSKAPARCGRKFSDVYGDRNPRAYFRLVNPIVK
jgi:hypothetical protein